jgi:hypothetical protein
MNTIKRLFSFAKSLPHNSGVLAVFLIVSTWGWLPSVGCRFFMKELWEFVVFIIIYLFITLILYLFIGNRLASKRVKVNTLIASICIALMIIQNGIIICLYAFRIFISKSSLYIAILASLFIVLICVETWIYIAKCKKD